MKDRKPLPSRDKKASTGGIEELLSRLKVAVVLGGRAEIRVGDKS